MGLYIKQPKRLEYNFVSEETAPKCASVCYLIAFMRQQLNVVFQDARKVWLQNSNPRVDPFSHAPLKSSHSFQSDPVSETQLQM